MDEPGEDLLPMNGRVYWLTETRSNGR
jgi:hypothetical protein